MKRWKNQEEFVRLFTVEAKNKWQKMPQELTVNEAYQTVAALVINMISEDWIKTNAAYSQNHVKQVYYFSLEFLLGRLLNSNLNNLGVREICRQGLLNLGFKLEEIIPQEDDAGLGNGGLGRLAACFIDSLASLAMPGHGCGIRYRYGLFDQKIINGQQVELPDDWLRHGYPWEVRRPDKEVEVRFGGNAYMRPAADGQLECVYEDYASVKAVPYDVPVIGYHNNTVNTLRLWSVEYEADIFRGRLNQPRNKAEKRYEKSLRKIDAFLYPDDRFAEGRQLRLMQEYFFVSAGVQSIVRHYKKKNNVHLDNFAQDVAIQINDMHPTLVIPELMRILLDEEHMDWTQAWNITCATVGYTNHTVLPEALEKWLIPSFKELLPRIYLIVEEIHRRWQKQVAERYPGDEGRQAEVGILWDNYVHMAALASVGSHSVNGVAKIHTEIIKNSILKPFYHWFPLKFNNKTNGVTHRRWLIDADPQLSSLLDEAIGTDWRKEPEQLRKLLPFQEDSGFLDKLAQVKTIRKEILASYIQKQTDIRLDPAAIFDIQIKRIHLYKRQLLNIAHVWYLYQHLLAHPEIEMQPHVFIFSGKAAVSYGAAKLCIQLINKVAQAINRDKRLKDKLKVVFVENYNVSLGELLFPAADISEQISTAGMEASGTGNMKFMMNGALTLGTLDGANVEIADRVGRNNCIIFGLTAEEVEHYRRYGGYSAWELYNKTPRIKRLMDDLARRQSYGLLYRDLLDGNDYYFVLKDFMAYCEAQEQAVNKYSNKRDWFRSSTVNIAESGYFSSDRTIREYAKNIWHIQPLPR